MKLGFSGGEQDDLERAFLAFSYGWPFALRLAAICGCVLHLKRADAAQLDAIVVDRACIELVGSEAGGGVVDFEQLNRPSRAVFDGGVDVVGVAGGGGEQERS